MKSNIYCIRSFSALKLPEKITASANAVYITFNTISFWHQIQTNRHKKKGYPERVSLFSVAGPGIEPGTS